MSKSLKLPTYNYYNSSIVYLRLNNDNLKEKIITQTRGKKPKPNPKHKKSTEAQIMRYRKYHLKQILLHNSFEYFLTITFAQVDNENNYKKVKRYFKDSKIEKYVLVAELSKKGRLHFHCLVSNIPYQLIEYKRKQKGKWINGYTCEQLEKFGQCDIRKLNCSFYDEQYHAVVNYMSKYITKSPDYKATYSRGLKRYLTQEEMLQIPQFYKKILDNPINID